MSKNAADILASKIINSLDQGTIPWNKPWKGGIVFPKNGITGNRYSGSNVMFLLMEDRQSNEWASYKQWASKGEQVRKGEKGTAISYYGSGKDKNNENKTFLFLKYSTVFNRDQLESWTTPVQAEATTSVDTIQACEQFLASNPMATLRIVHDKQDRAFYSPSLDYINLPNRSTFNSAESYYSTLFHELGHATGHKDRLNRKGIASSEGFGSHSYSEEELIAEMFSSIQCSMLGINNEALETNTLAYCQSWSKVLKNDSTIILKASKQAYSALVYMNKSMQASQDVTLKTDSEQSNEESQEVA